MLACLLALVLAQEPASNGGSRTADLHLLDEVVQIVNEEMLTSRKFIRAMYMENRGKPFASEEERMRLEQRVHENSVKYALRIQAGQDMGLDAAQVDREARAYIERRRDELGPVEFADMLRRSSMTLFEFQEWIRDRLYSDFWENYITGTGSIGQDARTSRDRYVRPGQLAFRYGQCIEHPELLHEIGGRYQSVVLQQLILDPRLASDPAAQRIQAEDLRRRILDGEDMSELVDRYGFESSKRNHGVIEPNPVEKMIARADPTLGAFVAGAKPGDLSEVMEVKARDRTLLRIVRLVDRLPAVVPELSAIEVQKKLEKGLRTDLSNWRLDQAFRVLYRSSYVWPTEPQR